MKKYAIINKKTKIVQNVITLKETSISSFPLDSNEILVPATRSVQIGMKYDEISKTFPEIDQIDKILDIRYEAVNLSKVHESRLKEVDYLTEEQQQVHDQYIRNLSSLNQIESYDEIIEKFELFKDPPEIPQRPRLITQDIFREVLTLTEKLLWDNPETGTTQQNAVINTLKLDFPHYGVQSMSDELELLEQVGFFTAQRVTEVTQALS